ncbi:hypothetical protein GGI07_002796, partial [Coemansia sp. Benny D115]
LSKQKQQQQQQQNSSANAAQGLAISYISSPPRLAGIPSSPPGSLAGIGGSSTSLNSAPLSPTSAYMDKGARYTPYGSNFPMATNSRPSMSGSKRGSIDHHYHSLQQQQQQQHGGGITHSSSLTSLSTKGVAHQYPHQQDGLSGNDADGSSVAQQQTMSSTYFDSLLAKTEQ